MECSGVRGGRQLLCESVHRQKRGSHRFNLAVKDYVKKEDELITKVQFLMPKLRTIKGRAILRRGSHLSLLLLRNDTRWPSTYEMVERYVKHQLLIVQLGYDLLVEHDVRALAC
ncbi:hypothetical protein PI124_g19674 [Phytophthora idaei]|nr:hypothetical protein PI126_g9296 [Phytophthora idaei]KAG3235288.1 hypothetical protein PI124_g19674 [Phytophthora idaei]